MELYIITGTSRGIGRALAMHALSQPNTIVLGIARTNSLSHPNFTFKEVDLASAVAVNNIQLPADKGFSKIILVNNAGMLGDVHSLGEISTQSIIDTIAVNITAPTLLLNNFLNFYAKSKAQKVVINISSGAGRRTIPSWSIYCTTKAALDMLSKVAQHEQIELGTNTKIFSVAPGVVDTAMQEQIRRVDKSAFGQVDDFRELKQNGLLETPEKVAEKIFQLVAQPDKHSEVVLDVRKF